MEFVIKPVLQQMADLYDLPRGPERFEHYLFMLQGNTKGEMILPIAGYNPMGKTMVQERIKELMDLNAEQVIDQHLTDINMQYSSIQPAGPYEVVINLSDDIGGAWTDRFASHYKNTFDFGPIANRNFCTPYFWTSDASYSENLIVDRTLEAVFRTMYFAQNGSPKTLEAHVRQEVFVNQHIARNQRVECEEPEVVRKFYETHKETEDYNLIFNFFYGDEASIQLGYKPFGIPESGGFKLVHSNLIAP